MGRLEFGWSCRQTSACPRSLKDVCILNTEETILGQRHHRRLKITVYRHANVQVAAEVQLCRPFSGCVCMTERITASNYMMVKRITTSHGSKMGQLLYAHVHSPSERQDPQHGTIPRACKDPLAPSRICIPTFCLRRAVSYCFLHYMPSIEYMPDYLGTCQAGTRDSRLQPRISFLLGLLIALSFFFLARHSSHGLMFRPTHYHHFHYSQFCYART